MIRMEYDTEKSELKLIFDEPNVNWKRSAAYALSIISGLIQWIRFEHGDAAAEAMLDMMRNMDEAAAFSVGEGCYADGEEKRKADACGDRAEDESIRPAQEPGKAGAGGSCGPGSEGSERG